MIIDENNSCWFETPINSKTTDSLLINLTRSPRKKGSRGNPPTSDFALPSMGGMDIFWNYTISAKEDRKIDR